MGRRRQEWFEKMKVIKWTEQVQDRLNWKDIVEKAKTLPEEEEEEEEEEEKKKKKKNKKKKKKKAGYCDTTFRTLLQNKLIM